MIEVDGIQINRVFSIECNADTGFTAKIMFWADDRLQGCTDPDGLQGYDVTVTKPADGELGYATVLLPVETNISFGTK